jgi:hypothetical protein
MLSPTSKLAVDVVVNSSVTVVAAVTVNVAHEADCSVHSNPFSEVAAVELSDVARKIPLPYFTLFHVLDCGSAPPAVQVVPLNE